MKRELVPACAEQVAEQAMDDGQKIKYDACSIRGCELLVSTSTGCAMLRGECILDFVKEDQAVTDPATDQALPDHDFARQNS